MRSIIIGAAVALTLPAAAQEAERYSLQKTENGYVRMDNRTGAMSICTEQSAQLVCRPAADERDALQDDIAALQDKLATIEARVASLEASKTPLSEQLPDEAEFEKTMTYMERFFRRFMGIVKDFEAGEGKVPGKT